MPSMLHIVSRRDSIEPTVKKRGTLPSLATRYASRRPRVAILTNYPFNDASARGGVETATMGLLEGLNAYTAEFDFHVIALSREIERHRTEQRKGMTFHFLAIPSAFYARPHVFPNILNARRCLEDLHPDLVHCQDNMALAVAAISTRPTKKIFTVHGIKSVESRVWEGPEYWSHQMDATFERWIRRQFDDVITISPYVDRFLPIHVRKHHITNSVRRLFFESPQTGESDSHRILFVGALTRLKRPADIVRAYAMLRQRMSSATLSLVGASEDAAYMDEMKIFIRENHIDGIEFLGSRRQEEVAALMRDAAVLVLSSVQENTPMVIAEAMASGLPVIASNVGGVPFMVHNDVDGLLYPCGDVESLATKMIGVLQSKDLRMRLSRSGRQKAAAEFSSDAVAAATVRVYREMLGVLP